MLKNEYDGCVIEVDGNTVKCKLADGFEGVAKCSPDDKFDLLTGIDLAYGRAVAKRYSIKEIEVGTFVRFKATDVIGRYGHEYVYGYVKSISRGAATVIVFTERGWNTNDERGNKCYGLCIPFKFLEVVNNG